MKKQRILVAAGLYPPDIGGPATYAKMIEGQLPQFGYDLTVLPFGTVRHLPKVIRHLAYAWALYRAAKETDVIYALDAISVGLPALLVSRCTRTPLIVRLGGDYAWEQGSQRFGVTATLDEYTKQRSQQGWRVRFLARLQDWVVRSARLVIVPSAYLRSIVLTWPGVKPEAVVVVYSALFPIDVADSKESLQKQLQYEDTVIVSAARLVPWKGFAVLLESFAALLKEHKATLVIVGCGPERTALESGARELGVSEQVRFTGSLSKSALGAAIKGADMFVLNTGYEGLSHQLLEVMALQVPIITTAVGGNPELITDGQDGLLVPYNDPGALLQAMERLTDNPAIGQALSKRALERSEDFNQQKVVKALAEELRNIL